MTLDCGLTHVLHMAKLDRGPLHCFSKTKDYRIVKPEN